MSLRTSLANMSLSVVPRLPKTPKTAEIACELETTFEGAQKAPVPIDPAAFIARMKAARASNNWRGITFRDWKLAAWVLFGGTDALADEPGFLDMLFNQYRAHKKRTAYHGLILSYLNNFDPTSKATRRVGKELAAAVPQFHWSWTSRQKQFNLFEPDKAPHRIAKACLAAGAQWADVLNSAGLGGSQLTGGLAAHAWSIAITLVNASLRTEKPNLNDLHTMLNWAVDRDPSGSSSQLRYPRHRALLASGLLLPWVDRPVPNDLKKLTVTFLLQHFNDPRLPSNTKNWLGVQPDAVAVLRKWLTRVALDQFFDVVDQVAQENMWRYRRAFWLAYYKTNVIDDAWVLFGQNARRYASKVFGKTHSYGVLNNGPGVLADHSVLLMRIGKLTIADWSHSGKCHIWLDGNRAAPKLYYSRYDRDAVVAGSDNKGQIHFHSEGGTWQGRVAEYIQAHTGIRVSPKSYMPRK